MLAVTLSILTAAVPASTRMRKADRNPTPASTVAHNKAASSAHHGIVQYSDALPLSHAAQPRREARVFGAKSFDDLSSWTG
jgi:hypothetical protein